MGLPDFSETWMVKVSSGATVSATLITGSRWEPGFSTITRFTPYMRMGRSLDVTLYGWTSVMWT